MSFKNVQGNHPTASIRIPRQSPTPSQTNNAKRITIESSNDNGLKIVKSFSNQSNSYSEQRLASSITNYLYASLSPPSPTSYKVKQIFLF